jgi:hypothetical protein
MKIILTVLLLLLLASCQEQENPKLDCNCGEVLNGVYIHPNSHILVQNYCTDKREWVVISGKKYLQYTYRFCYTDEPHYIDK